MGVAVAAEVVIDAGASEHGAGAAIVSGHLARHDADTSCALDEDRVLREERVVLLDPFFEPVEEDADGVSPEEFLVGTATGERGKTGRDRDRARQIVRRASDGDVTVGQPGSAGFFEQVEDDLPLTEGVEERAEAAEVEAIGTHADKVRSDASQLSNDEP